MLKIYQIISKLLPLLFLSSIAQATITTDISSLASSSHPINLSDNAIKRQITMTWNAADSTDSTLNGYYYIFDTDDATNTTLSEVLTGTQIGSAVSVTSSVLGDSNSHYFHIVAFDTSGTFGSVTTEGPLVINTTPEVSTVVDGSGDNSGSNGTDQTLTISGSRFMDAVSVTVGSTSLQSVTRNSSSQITATVSSGFSTGTHDVNVTNTAVSKSNTLSSAYTVSAANTAPTASAAGAGGITSYTKSNATDTVTISLTAADSTDTDGDSLTYTWSVDTAPDDASDSSLSSTSSATPTYQTDIAGSYIFGLIVNDGTVSSDKVQITVTVNDPGNTPPSANAGADQSVTANGSPLTLSGSQSTDTESAGSLTYSWTITSSPSGSTANLGGVTTNETATLNGYDVAGSYTIQLVVTDEGSLTDSDEMVVTASIGSVSASTSLLSLNSTDTTVGSSFTASVTPKDVNSNWLGTAATVAISSTLGDASGTVISDASGTYTLTFTSTTSGTGTVTATVNGTPINASDTVTFNPGALSPSVSMLDAIPVIASASDTITVSVTPKDQYGNKLSSGQTVVITPTPTGAGMNGSVSESSGVYSQTFTMDSTDTTFTATVEVDSVATAIDATDTVRFVTTAPSASNSTIAADVTDNLTANSSDTSTITVTVNDNQGAPIGSGNSVTLSSSDSSDTVSDATDTNGSGVAIFTVKSTVVGTKTITAVVDVNGDAVSLGTIELAFVAGSATAITVKSGNSQSAIVGNAVTNPLTVTVTDANGNPVSGAQVDFAVISVDATGTLSDASDTTNSSGDASSTLTLATTSGTVEVRAVLNGTSASDTFTTTASPAAVSIGSSGFSTIVIGDASTTVDTTDSLVVDASTTVWLTLKDQYGNLVGNTNTLGEELIVTFSAQNSAGGVLSTKSYDSTTKTYTTAITAPQLLSTSSSGTPTISATVDAIPIVKSVEVTYVPDTLSTSQSTLSAAPTIASDGDSVTVTVTPKDQYGNNLLVSQISGVVIGFGGTSTDATDSDSNGTYTASFTMSGVSVDATSTINGSLIDASSTVVNTASTLDSSTSTLSSDKSSIVVGATTAIITVTPKNSSSAALGAGLTVKVTTTKGYLTGLNDATGTTITAKAATDSSDNYFVTLAGVDATDSGTAQITATVYNSTTDTLIDATDSVQLLSGSADIDGDGSVTTLDGWMLYRYALKLNKPGAGATYTTNSGSLISASGTRDADQIQSLLASAGDTYDIDSDQSVTTLDGWMLYRYALKLNKPGAGATYTTNSDSLISASGTRDASSIQQYLDSINQ